MALPRHGKHAVERTVLQHHYEHVRDRRVRGKPRHPACAYAGIESDIELCGADREGVRLVCIPVPELTFSPVRIDLAAAANVEARRGAVLNVDQHRPVVERPQSSQPVSKKTVRVPTVSPGAAVQLPLCVPLLELLCKRRVRALPPLLFVM